MHSAESLIGSDTRLKSMKNAEVHLKKVPYPHHKGEYGTFDIGGQVKKTR